ncbi:uncharacterized protein F4807DRAFT_118455 [Annulohypoxylon truncatum]|uniref:uncharacterized protein n=1 Tax=Annulohypoxylon truncatum TaxID=327061 RepID=UPI002008B41A|nr:uncharacterized protein F4807DRAFT_118455 [Annulohypoxylon truncatum]KAI1214232.1 hypothetical protein F4807DRAFT_118455 [Annulohypoxylon truncatum]
MDGKGHSTMAAQPLPTEGDETIYQAALRCKDALNSCLEFDQLMHHEWAENRIFDFNLWAAGNGVFALNKASLDQRLAGEQTTLNFVVMLLTMLYHCIEKCKVFASGNSQSESGDGATLLADEFAHNKQQSPDEFRNIPRPLTPCSDQSSDSEDEESDKRSNGSLSPLYLAKESVVDSLDNLLRLCATIRKAGANFRFQKADKLYNPSELSEFRQYLEAIIHARGFYKGGFDPKGQIPGVSPSQERLIEANLRRRSRFLYFQKHSEKLAPNHERLLGTDSYQKIGKIGTKTPNVDTSCKAPLAMGGTTSKETPSKPGSRIARTDTTATMLDTGFIPAPYQSPPSQVTSAVSKKVEYPKPPLRKDDLRSFKCPCCGQTLPATTYEKNNWKRHLIDDVQPYTCIAEECPMPHKLYTHKEEWMDHLREDHPKCWHCPLCSTPRTKALIFPSENGLSQHIREAHTDAVSSSLLPTLITASVRPKPFGITHCPLCDEIGEVDSHHLLDHISEHIHQFSLESLPWPDDPLSGDYFEEGKNVYFDNMSDDSLNGDDIPRHLGSDFEGLSSISSDKEDAPRERVLLAEEVVLEVRTPDLTYDHVEGLNDTIQHLAKIPEAEHSNICHDRGDSAHLENSLGPYPPDINDYPTQSTDELLAKIGTGIDSQDPYHEFSDIPCVKGQDKTLEEQLRNATRRYPRNNGQKFIPVGDFDKIITRENVRREVQSWLPKDRSLEVWVEAIWDKFDYDEHAARRRKAFTSRRKIFAILVLFKAQTKIALFIREELYDKDLPFVQNEENKWVHYSLKSQNEQRLVECLNQLEVHDADSFDNYQWLMLSPIFNMAEDKVIHYDLHARITLPYLEHELAHDPGLIGVKGDVSRIRIHESHYTLGSSMKDPSEYFAIKQLSFPDKSRFDAKVESLKRFSCSNHPHLIKLLATYQYKEKLYLIFPWADGNLRDLWRMNSKPVQNYSMCRWIADQCRGIAKGLRMIHNNEFKPNMTSLQPNEKKVERHGDMKPENILWFRGPGDNEQFESNMLKISDFGLTRWHGNMSNDETDLHKLAVSRSYRAPEYDLWKPVSQSWDIWSLACVYLEFITWYLCGWNEGVDEFSKDRTKEISTLTREGNRAISEDDFFNLVAKHGSTANSNGKYEASLKRSVISVGSLFHDRRT